LTRAQERSLADTLADFHDEEQVEKIVAEALASPRTTRALRLQLLRALADPRIDSLPGSWSDSLGRALDSGDRGLCREAVATVKMRDLGRFDRRLQALSRQPDLPTELRLAALDCIAGRQRQLPASDFTLLTGHLSDPTPVLERLTAARALGASRLAGKQLLQLAEYLPKAGPTEGMLVLPAFSRSRDSAAGLALVDALKRSPAVALMSVGDLDRLLAPYPEKVQESAKPLRARLAAQLEQRRADLARLAARLPPGNARRGQAVFFSENSTCSVCHRAAGKGGSVGTNLSKIGFIRTQAELLESIVLPSAYIAPEFRTYTAVTTRGRSASGLWAGETAEAIFLRTGTPNDTRIPRKEIETLTLSSVSLMPEGFDKVLSRQELSDLVEFLLGRR
jgi:putative heme-binding domain-containing protein